MYSLSAAALRATNGGGHKAPGFDEFTAECGNPDNIVRMAENYLFVGYKWPLVDKSLGASIKRVEGWVNEIHVSGDDTWTLHKTNDVHIELNSIGPEDSLLAYDRKTIGFESETADLPPNRDSGLQARPSAGDHAIIIGRWAWDCDHHGTELHPCLTAIHSSPERLRRTISCSSSFVG